MRTVIGRFTPQVFAIMRIVTGLLFACHGSSKLLGWPASDMHPPLASLPGLSGIIELVCGLLIAVGFLTGIAAFIASGEMAAAYFIAHFPQGPIPLLNKGELAVVYCFLWLFVAAHGAGIWSVDNAMRKR
ncbi:MAG TPA: DoxX family protein [Vicinamibacterales bacterium]|nr:DoxX family protein [Vicinamibacterales bacterium]